MAKAVARQHKRMVWFTLFVFVAGGFAAWWNTLQQATHAAQTVPYQTLASLGDPKAPVRVLVVGDIFCPHCKKFHDGTYEKMKSKYVDTGKVHLYFGTLLIQTASAIPALAGRVLREVDMEGYWKYFELAYHEQDALMDPLRDLAKQLEGVTDKKEQLELLTAAFRKTIEALEAVVARSTSPENAQQVKEVLEAEMADSIYAANGGTDPLTPAMRTKLTRLMAAVQQEDKIWEKAGIDTTPKVYVDEVEVRKINNWPQVDQAIQQALQKKQAAAG